MSAGKKIKYKIAIVGGGRACKFFLELISTESFQYLDIEVLGVCDIDPEAEGIKLAREKGLCTTDNFRDFFKLKDLNAIIELTNNKVLPELIEMRPGNVGIIEHNIGKLARKLFEMHHELVQTKQEASFDKKFYEILFQQTNLGVVVLDTDFTILDANRAYTRTLNKHIEEIVGEKCYKVVKSFYVPCPAESEEFECPLIKTMETGKSAHMIHESRMENNDTAYFNITTYPLKDSRGNIFRIIELWRDITSVITKKWEKRVRRMESDMKKLIQEDRMISLGKLVASSVHEINNPIQGLLTFSCMMEEILQKEHISERDLASLKAYMPHMTQELERCGNIVSGLLAFSRGNAMEFKKVNINDIIASVLSLTGHKLALSDIELKTETAAVPLTIYGDENQLQQCLLNLVFNAIEAMPEGGSLTVCSKLDSDEKTIEIAIADSGCGIESKDMEHIFDPFFTTKEIDQGTGLGLSIVYGIIKDHKGDIRVESSPDKGTTFIIRLPAAQNFQG